MSSPHWARPPDPYQPIEGTYRITRGTLEALARADNPVGIVTKGPMIVRDIDLLQDLSRRASCRVHISIPSVDEDAWERLEPGVAHPMQRLRAVRHLVDAGIDAGVLMAPIVPGITSHPEKLERTIKAIAETGARSVGVMVMHLEGATRDHFLRVLAREYPHLQDRYTELYATKYARKDYVARVQEVAGLIKGRYGLASRPRHRRSAAPAAPR